MRLIKILLFSILVACTCIGIGVVLFFGLHAVGIFNDPGVADPQAELFSLTASQIEDAYEKTKNSNLLNSAGTVANAETLPEDQYQSVVNTENPWPFLCKLVITRNYFPNTAERIYTVYHTLNRPVMAEYMLTALRIRHANLYNEYAACDTKESLVMDTLSITPADPEITTESNVPAVGEEESNSHANGDAAYPWMNSEEWMVLSTALIRDKDIILKTAERLEISPRLLVVPVIGEQLRYYTSDRSTFKSYLKPMQRFMYLGKFSYGIAGMKPETAERVEQNLKNTQSPFYLGSEYEDILNYPETITDKASERLLRIDNKKNHDWVYMYVGLYLKQFEAQWSHAGYPISGRPDILATLYNLGHNRSVPKANPDAGGAPITINGVEYTFGGLAYDFYWSGVLLDVFPY